MEIRFASTDDDKNHLAKLIYNVDPYIYPYWFSNNEEEGVRTLSKLLDDESSIFYYKNCIVAKEGNEFIGIFSFIPANSNFSRDYSKYDVNFESHHVIQYYILDVINNLMPDDVCVVGLFVDPKYRRKHIATKMFNFLFNNIPAKTFSLEVLANNNAALHLYNKFSFEIAKTYRGYNGYKKRKPLCHIMRKLNV